MTIKKNDKIINKYFKDKYVKSRVYIKKINETRNYLLEEIKLNDLRVKSITRHTIIWIVLSTGLV